MAQSPKLTDKDTRKLLAANKGAIFNYEFFLSEAGTVASTKRFNGSKHGAVLLLDLKYDLQPYNKPKIEWLKCVKVEEKKGPKRRLQGNR